MEFDWQSLCTVCTASNRTSGSLTQPQSCFIPTRLLIKRWFTPTIGITLFIPGHWGWTTITRTPQSREDFNLWISKVERLCPASDPHLYGLIFNGNNYFFLSIPSPPQGCVWAQGPREKNHTSLYLCIPQSSFRYYLAGNVNNLGQVELPQTQSSFSDMFSHQGSRHWKVKFCPFSPVTHGFLAVQEQEEDSNSSTPDKTDICVVLLSIAGL